ncbi:TPA: glycosyl transferase [Klebsiella pneumoniae]|uniref:ATP-grasp fold amidoligase family protein n=1 Tax=Klebsiella pneumoniae TaxID=573 RepID=UPI002659B760|nr:ATP-grasp fold amidoligase family protein [Klebsiella pneumoniae]HBW3329025.1 glycosyl transferase [Klebsiella pneumoniae]
MKLNWSHEYFRYLLRISRHYLRSDKIYRVNKFKKDFGYYPDLIYPATFNEKILYRMINPTNTNFINKLADKLQVRDYVENINKDILPEIYGVFDHADCIDISFFPERFVLKCNHDTGSFVICTDKKAFDIDKAKSKLSLHLKMNMYYKTREWQYKKIKPLIFCEEYIDRHCMRFNGLTPDIFRFHCFHSNALYVEVEFIDDKDNHYTNIYDGGWNIEAVCLNDRPNAPSAIPKPEKFDEAIRVAESLSKGLDYCRIDLYLTSKKIYFSEFTFSPNNGRERFSPVEWDLTFGKNWNVNR